MRCTAGFLCLALSSVALAQARGHVESVGFGGAYRPGCWTPMVVYLAPTTGSVFNGRIEVLQDDLDKDQVLFTRQIALTGNDASGGQRSDRFWMYFIPQPNRDKGALDAGLSPDQLSAILRVRLCTDSGKELVKLPITQTITPLESMRDGMSAPGRGRRVVLCVYDQSHPNLIDFQGMVGLSEDVVALDARKLDTDLPDDVRGYDAIDAICWTDADPEKLSADQVAAIEAFVRRGGRLVFPQDTATNQWQRNGARFAALMPVTVSGVEERKDKLPTLRKLARAVPGGVPAWGVKSSPAVRETDVGPWDLLKGPFRYAVARAKPAARVVEWQRDEKGEPILDAKGEPKPYAVRMAVGSGCVTWAAQDLGDRQLQGSGNNPTHGWAFVWDELFDWPDDPVVDVKAYESAASAYHSGMSWELGGSLRKYMDVEKGVALVGIAVLFFILYWVAAGPGSYLVLAKRGRAALSWFVFAAIAIAAAGMTVGIVRVVLRVPAELRHVTVVRQATPGEPADVRSDFGLYIPRDGLQRIALKETAPGRPSYLTAWNVHPAFNREESEFPARQEYVVPVKAFNEPNRAVADPTVVNIPYRSTLKRMAAHWSGDVPGKISGTAVLGGEMPWVRGTLVNDTGHDLRAVYLAVHNPGIVANVDKEGNPIQFQANDLVLYRSIWKNGETLDLGQEWGKVGGATTITAMKTPPGLIDRDRPNALIRYRGRIYTDRNLKGADNWLTYWYNSSWRTGYSGGTYDEKDALSPVSFPLLSFFDRLYPARNDTGYEKKVDRFDFLRRGARDLDTSAVISAGQMSVIAVSTTGDEPLPFPLEVDGERVTGKGVVYYQFVVPVDASAVTKAPVPAPKPPATSPASTKPVTRPATTTSGKAG